MKIIKHGMSSTRIYSTWNAMKQRCSNKNNTYYQDYGGRGIKVCAKWVSFLGFYEDMGERPKGRTLDRIDNDKGYYKENCRWATQEEQHNNKRSNHLIEIDGVIKNMRQWEKFMGFTKAVIANRIRRGWSERKAVLTQAKRRNVN